MNFLGSLDDLAVKNKGFPRFRGKFTAVLTTVIFLRPLFSLMKYSINVNRIECDFGLEVKTCKVCPGFKTWTVCSLSSEFHMKDFELYFCFIY